MIEEISQDEARKRTNLGEIVWLSEKVFPLNAKDPLKSLEKPAKAIGADYVVIEALRQNPLVATLVDYDVNFYKAKQQARLPLPDYFKRDFPQASQSL